MLSKHARSSSSAESSSHFTAPDAWLSEFLVSVEELSFATRPHDEKPNRTIVSEDVFSCRFLTPVSGGSCQRRTGLRHGSETLFCLGSGLVFTCPVCRFKCCENCMRRPGRIAEARRFHDVPGHELLVFPCNCACVTSVCSVPTCRYVILHCGTQERVRRSLAREIAKRSVSAVAAATASRRYSAARHAEKKRRCNDDSALPVPSASQGTSSRGGDDDDDEDEDARELISLSQPLPSPQAPRIAAPLPVPSLSPPRPPFSRKRRAPRPAGPDEDTESESETDTDPEDHKAPEPAAVAPAPAVPQPPAPAPAPASAPDPAPAVPQPAPAPAVAPPAAVPSVQAASPVRPQAIRRAPLVPVPGPLVFPCPQAAATALSVAELRERIAFHLHQVAVFELQLYKLMHQEPQ